MHRDSDITRPVPNETILTPLLETLETAASHAARSRFLVATGMHRPNQGEELARMVGRDVVARYRIENTSARTAANYRRIDAIDGAPIEVNRHYLDAGCAFSPAHRTSFLRRFSRRGARPSCRAFRASKP